MLKLKTHFKQVPLDIVRKIVEEQIRRETTTEKDPGTKRQTLKKKPVARARSTARSARFLRRQA
jgi:hypothetical protein